MKNFKSFSSKKKVKLPLGLKEMIEPWDSVATVIVVNHQVSDLSKIIVRIGVATFLLQFYLL